MPRRAVFFLARAVSQTAKEDSNGDTAVLRRRTHRKNNQAIFSCNLPFLRAKLSWSGFARKEGEKYEALCVSTRWCGTGRCGEHGRRARSHYTRNPWGRYPRMSEQQ